MGYVHLYSAKSQPLVRYAVDLFGETRWFTNPGRKLFYCQHCGRRRWAEKLVVQVYYDCSVISCAVGHAHQFGDRRRRMVPADSKDAKRTL